MKDLLPKLMSVFNLAKGKKPVVLILSVVAVLVLYYAASKGWITGEVVTIEQIVDGISSAFPADTVKAVVDTVANDVVVDSAVIDSVIAQ